MATNSNSKLEDKVRDVLRAQKINLRKNPYVTDRGTPVLSALEQLVKSWEVTTARTESVAAAEHQQSLLADLWSMAKQEAEKCSCNSRDREQDSNKSERDLILQALQFWQTHALSKLTLKAQQASRPASVVVARFGSSSRTFEAAEAMTLKITVLGLPVATIGDWMEAKLPKKSHGEDDAFCATTTMTLRDQPQTTNATATTATSKSALVICLEGVPSVRTNNQLVEYLHTLLQVSRVKVFHRGKPVASTDATDAKPLWECVTAPSEASQKHAVYALLCFASSPFIETGQEHNQQHQNDVHTRIAAMRTTVANNHAIHLFDITDQRGSVVPMSKDDRLSFFTALVLHRMGRRSLCDYENSTSGDNDSSSTTQQYLQDSLILLLEADAEWNSHHLEAWKDRVDNYGLLQLDIVWTHLQVESLTNLPDSLQRLAKAESVLTKQVNPNFLTLALEMAGQGNSQAVPPLATVFAKLLLLQGIAYAYDGESNPESVKKGKERLDDAFVLIQCLRSVAPEESVETVLQAASALSTGHFTRTDAINALRKSGGELNAAAFDLSDGAFDYQKRQEDRETQRSHGSCDNGISPVDLALVKTLARMLIREEDATSTVIDATRKMNSVELAVGLLRLANNDADRALEIYSEQNYEHSQVAVLVDALDQRLFQQGLLDRATLARKKRRRISRQVVPVDDMALATLVSIGVEDHVARCALQKSGNDTDKALLWITQKNDQQVPVRSDVASTRGADRDEDTRQAEEGGEKVTQENEAQKDETVDVDSEFARLSSEQGGNRAPNPLHEAQELLKQELGHDTQERCALLDEYLGNSLDDEWRLLQKYRSSK